MKRELNIFKKLLDGLQSSWISINHGLCWSLVIHIDLGVGARPSIVVPTTAHIDQDPRMVLSDVNGLVAEEATAASTAVAISTPSPTHHENSNLIMLDDINH